MKESNIIDGGTTQDNSELCGNALFGNDSGQCPGCRKRKALMLNGHCATCSTKRGIHPFSSPADAAAASTEKPKQE